MVMRDYANAHRINKFMITKNGVIVPVRPDIDINRYASGKANE